MARGDIWTVGGILKWTEQYFRDKGVESPRLDAEVLLSHVLGKERIFLYVHFDEPLQQDELTAFRELVKRRAQRVPVAYILGKKEFMGLDFRVTPDVLIPRPDTEILAEAAIEKLKACCPAARFLDIGTGSGAIALSLLAHLPQASADAVDISAAAIDVAAQNAQNLAVAERVRFLLGDVYAPVRGQLYDAILSNPPYIPGADIAGLSPEVRGEPRGALDGGADGLDFYRQLVREGADLLRTGGFMAFEVGIGQARAVARLGEEAGSFEAAEIKKDYGGIDRVVILEKRK